MTTFGLTIQPIKRQVRIATTGSRRLFAKKSSMPKMLYPAMATKSRTLYPRHTKTATTILNTVTIPTAAGRLMLNFSIRAATGTSYMQIAEVSAAKNTQMKKSAPTISPPGKVSKTCGSASNIRPGPAPRDSGEPPEKTNAAGTIKRPANTATPVSKISIM